MERQPKIMKIRLSHITNLTDARYAAAEGFDWLGFNFQQGTPNAISSLKAKEIIGWLAGPMYYGKFNGRDLEEIKGIVGLLSLNAIEIPIETFDPELFQIVDYIFLDIELNNENILTIQPRLQALEQLISNGNIGLIVHGNQALNLSKSSTPFDRYMMVSTIHEYLQMKDLNFSGIDLKGTDETKPGFSDWEQIADIVEVLKEEY
ncbi:MAG: hypothetical protein HYZ42_09910 [Bacteroidetes bacterium]|nr:hypothetical protein [Bacteroidota bacterium]